MSDVHGRSGPVRTRVLNRGVLLVALFVIGLIGAGWAIAKKPPYVGQTYAKAAAKILSNNQTPMIRTVIGGELATDDCIVTNAQKSKSRKRTWLLDLNCTHLVASPGHPGNSVTTPQGKVAHDRQVRADNWDKQVAAYLAGGTKVPWCGRNESHTTTCNDFCARHGICSKQLLQYLADLG